MTDSPLILDHIEDLTIDATGRLAQMYQLSPFVWHSGARYEILLRAVPSRDDNPALKISEAWWGWSDDGLRFTMDRAPCLWADPDGPDRDGCEDPTVVPTDDGLHLWYSGWNGDDEVGRLLHAVGPSPDRLTKTGVVLDSSDQFANPKEAELWRTPSGEWALAFEFARDGRSLMGADPGPVAGRTVERAGRPDAAARGPVGQPPSQLRADPDGPGRTARHALQRGERGAALADRLDALLA